jgi:2',3'-cyclic-nucleotide 2'-phosphodiesterase (5'-nucleotidase family)
MTLKREMNECTAPYSSTVFSTNDIHAHLLSIVSVTKYDIC